MFDLFKGNFKEEVVKSLVDIAAGLKFKNPEKVFPVLQITYRKLGREKPAPKSLQFFAQTVRPIDAEALVYLLKSEDEYYVLSLRNEPKAIITDGKALGKYHKHILKSISPDIPMSSIAYGSPEYSIDFNTVNITHLFFTPLNTQDKYCMDYFSQLHKKNINGFVKDFPA